MNLIDTVGNTPLLKFDFPKGTLWGKAEFLNPGGSIKDRIGKYILEQAKLSGKLKEGGTIIEGTSGNTGVGICLYANTHGYKTVFVMADKQSKEKIDNLKAYGAKVIVCPTNVAPEDPRSYYSVAAELAKLPNSFHINQYSNKYNGECHYVQTGPEVFKQTEGKFDVLMAAVGTGGTISGTGKFLKEKMPNLKVVGVDCEGSILAHFKKTGEMIEGGSYVLEGIGEDFLPENVKFDVIDDFVVVGDEESFQMTRDLLKKECVYTGGSGGSAVLGAIRYAETLKEPKRILVILPDSGNRYASKVYNDDWMKEKGYTVDSDKDELDGQIQELIKDNGKLI